MNKHLGIFAAIVSVATALFFGLCYPYHLHHQEQMQLFLTTADYAGSVILSAPGGAMDYAGRFVTQFYYYAWPGAIVLGVLAAVAYVLGARVLRRVGDGSVDALWPDLLALPATAVGVAFVAGENSLVGGWLALMLTLGALLLRPEATAGRLKSLLFDAAMLIVLYLLAGPVCALYALVSALADVRRGQWLTALLLVLLPCLVAGVCVNLFPYPATKFFTGIHYCRVPEEKASLLWLAVWVWTLAASASLFVRPLRLQAEPSLGVRAVAGLAGIVLSAGIVAANWHGRVEETMMYDYMARQGMWNRIMQAADRRNPTNGITSTALNLALAQSNRMSNHLFDYAQHGADGLLPDFMRDAFSPLVTSEVYYHLGFVNTAQRFTFEAQEAIPDFQKSARCYRRLAQTNLINGSYAVARKYLEALTHTIYYSAWARETMLLLGNDSAIARHPEYGRLRELRHTTDFIYSDRDMEAMLGRQVLAHPTFRLAFDYLMSYALLSRHIEVVPQYIALSQQLGYVQLPRVYAEALMLSWSKTHRPTDPLPPYLSQAQMTRINDFYRLAQAHDDARLRQQFGQTYWYYYFYCK